MLQWCTRETRDLASRIAHRASLTGNARASQEVCDYSKTVPRGTLWETSQLEVVAGWCSDWMELTRREVAAL